MAITKGPASAGPARPTIGYVVSQYPAVNHTFILREIRTLRSLGYPIEVVSIRPADRPIEALSATEAEEARQTYSLLAAGKMALLQANLLTFLGRPFAYLAGFVYAMRLAAWDLRKMLAYCFYFAEAVAAGRYLWQKGVRHTHTHFSSTVVLLLSRVFPITFSATIHGSAEFEDVVGFHMREKVAKALFLITISKYGASQVMKPSAPKDWHKVHDVPLGVDPEVYAPRPMPRHDLDHPFQITTVGKLEPPKGLMILIEAIGLLVRRGKTNLRVNIIGEGFSRPDAEAAVRRLGLQQYVQLPGAKNHEAVLEVYRQTHLFVMASFAEGVPVVLMEAMAMGIPCVATGITGIPELIRADVDGLLVPPADAESLAAAIDRLQVNTALYEALSASGRQRVLEKYNLPVNAQRLAEVFARYLAAPAP